jgi:hypothetical protein
MTTRARKIRVKWKILPDFQWKVVSGYQIGRHCVNNASGQWQLLTSLVLILNIFIVIDEIRTLGFYF